MENNFDPVTGEIINQSTTEVAASLNSNEVANNVGNVSNGGEMKKKSIVPKVIAAVVLVAIIAVVGIKAIGGSSSSAKILAAVKNTLDDKSEFVKDLTVIDILKNDEFSMEVEAVVEGSGVKINCDKDNKQQQIDMKFDVSGYPSIDGTLLLNQEALKLQIPMLTDRIITYNYKEEPGEFLSENVEVDDLEFISEFLELAASTKKTEQYYKELGQIFMNEYEKLAIKNVDSKKFEVDGKDVKCDGYSITITEDNLVHIVNQLEALTDEYYGFAQEYLGEESSYKEFRESISGMEDSELVIYIYKNKVAAIQLKDEESEVLFEFLGGDTRLQNVRISDDGEVVMEVKGIKEDSKEIVRCYEYDEEVLAIAYDYEDGNLTITDDMGSEIHFNIEANKNEWVMTLVESEAVDDVSMNVKFSKETNFEKLEGKEFNVMKATEEEYQEFVYEAYAGIQQLQYLMY